MQADIRNTIEGGTTQATFSEPQPFQTIMNSPIRNVSDDVMGTWHHTLEGGSEATLRVYYDHIDRHGEAGIASARASTALRCSPDSSEGTTTSTLTTIILFKSSRSAVRSRLAADSSRTRSAWQILCS